MSQIYVWQSAGLSEPEAQKRFVDVIDRKTAFYNEHLSTGCNYKYTQIGKILIGQISSDLGINNWDPWHQNDDCGIAWSGICEDYLGFQPSSALISRLVKEVIERPRHLTDLTGSFSVCVWDLVKEEIALATGATQHQTLWQTNGPYGWAIGSRAKILLELVGHVPQIDEEEVSVFLAYKYLLSQGSLYKNVTRVSVRQQIRLSPYEPPRQTEYQSLSDYLGSSRVENFAEAVEICADSLKSRVARQLRFSKNPVLLLTGGKDSRCIASALYHTGFSGPALTGGSQKSLEVKVASQVAQKLGYNHLTKGGVDDIDLLGLLAESRSRARLWTKISEGVETIQHGLHYSDFFRYSVPFPASVTQCFNGHHAGLQKPSVVSYTPDKLNKKVGPHLKCQDAVIDRFEQMQKNIQMELQALGMPASRWSELYLWQIDALQWGQDNLGVKDLFAWYWAPLFDKILIQTGWYLPEIYQASMRFVEAITLKLTPQLAGIHDLSAPPSTHNSVYKTIALIRRKARSLLSKNGTQVFFSKPDRKVLWETLLLKAPQTNWKEWIDEAYIKEAIDYKHSEVMLWNTISIQLFIEANLLD